MFFNNSALVLAQNTEVLQPTLFPFPFKAHLVFCIASLLLFVFQYIMDKKPYQLIFAVAVPASLLLWLSESRTLFYAVGIMEGVLLFAALVTGIIFRDKSKPGDKNMEVAETEEASSECSEVSPENNEEEPSAEPDVTEPVDEESAPGEE